MTAWMLYDLKDYTINKEYYKMHYEKGKKLGMSIQLILVDYLSFGIRNNSYYVQYKNKDIELPNIVISRTRYPLLSKQLEYMGVAVYNNSTICDICNDKAKTYQLIGSLGIPMIPTDFIKSEYTENIMQNPYLFNDSSTSKNTIIKSTSGHGGKEVYTLEEYIDNKSKDMSSTIYSDMVIQPLIKGTHQDIRVYVLNNEIKASVLRTSSSGFKSNYSLGGEVELFNIDTTLRNTIYKILELLHKTSANCNVPGLFYGGIDFIIDEKGHYLFNEIEDVVGSRMLYKVSNIDIVEEYLFNILQSF